MFYDESGAGNPVGAAPLPLVQVTAGGVTASTAIGSGRAVLLGVPGGPQMVTVRAETLPPFFTAPAPRTVQVPSAADVFVPVTLPIGANRPFTYMAFGDSITVGDGSSDGSGYRGRLQGMLDGYFGRGTVIDQGVGGTLTGFGARRLVALLGQVMPAYTLIQYGTNDYSNPQCSIGGPAPPCPTTNNLRKMVRDARAAQSLPFLATVIPTDPDFNPPERNRWVSDLDEEIRVVAREEGAVLVDLERAFLAAGDLRLLYTDSLHPNDAGYEVMAETFFGAIAHGMTPAAASLPARHAGQAPLVPLGPDFAPGWRDERP